MLYLMSNRSMSKAAREATWEAFMAHGTSHSSRAATLPYVINRCERERIPYTLSAVPGQGYFIEPTKETRIVR